MRTVSIRITAFAVLCFVFWSALAMDVDPLSLAGALGFSVLATVLSVPLTSERHPLHVSLLFWRLDRLLIYGASVLLQSYVAVFELIFRMLFQRYTPGFVRIRTRLRSSVGRVVLANTISLVPGTLSLWLDEDHVIVHWFDRKTTHALRAGRMIKANIERRLARIFG